MFGYIDIGGKRRKLYAFSMILGYSRMRYVEFTNDISTENVTKMYLNAFKFFGGFTDTILYDNMKQVVIDPKIKDSESRFNQQFMDFAEYCGIVIRLCYPYNPDTKGKIESTIKCTVYLASGQITKRIKVRLLPFHLPFVLQYFSPSSIALPSQSLPP